MTEHEPPSPGLKRSLNLPLLVFYGLGVTVGAGIFALIGEILTVSGDAAAMAFLLSGIIAGATGFSYALLVGVLPKAGGDAVFVARGIGPVFGWITGLGVVVTGIISSSVIALAFAGYAGTLIGVPQWALVAGVVAFLAAIACWGALESVIFAAVITLLEVGTLAIIVIVGLPQLQNLPPVDVLAGLDGGWVTFVPVVSGAVIAFFAFIGFEDIENMVEETLDPTRTAPRAILWTLGITVVIYVVLALVAVSTPGRAAVAGSQAPLAELFEQTTGFGHGPVAAMAAVAMINGILVQILMAARTLFGMANEGLIPAWFGKIGSWRRTPVRATLTVSALIMVLAFSFPLVGLAQATSFVVLGVFTLVNLSLFVLGGRPEYPTLKRWRWWGIVGAILSALIPAFMIWSGTIAGH